jgi:hypothetical protein
MNTPVMMPQCITTSRKMASDYADKSLRGGFADAAMRQSEFMPGVSGRSNRTSWMILRKSLTLNDAWHYLRMNSCALSG